MKKYTILCVDDNRNNLYSLEALLSTLEHVEIILAESGAKALETLLISSVDLILLDVQMPEMDGFSVASFVKSNKKTQHIPIIFISAVFTSESFISRGYKTGAIDYLAKPIDDTQLLNKIAFYTKLFRKEQELQDEKDRLQNILDMQDNLIMVVDREEIIQVNHSFLDFVGYKTLHGFRQKHFCICDLFIEDEGYLKAGEHKAWLDEVMQDHDKTPVAIIPFHNQNRYFAVRVNILDLKREQFIVTFTDITHIELESKEFEREAVRDPLTNVYNRRKFDMELKKLFYISNKYRMKLCLLMIDVDHFKRVNDTYGHQCGDDVLVELSSRISKQLREGDLLARYGGEEFVVVLPKSSLSSAMNKAYQLNKAIANTMFDEVGRITVSIGIASLKEDDDIDSVIKRADKALYLAKENGRNRVETVEIT